MGLLAPWFLAGLGLLGLPVYLHLLKRHRSETQPFSSLMFFEKSTQADLKHRRLDYLLLLAARLALLALMVLAFAQPYLWRAGAGGDQVARLAVIDTSASMGFGDRMARARREAMPLVRQGARLAAFDSRLRLLAPADLAGLQPTTSMSSFGELARALRAYQENVKQAVEVHLFSDMQRSSMPAGFKDLQLNGSARLVLHPLSDRTEANWTVESVSAPSRVRDGRAARIQATVAGFHTPASRKSVSLEVNGRTVATQSVEVPEEGRAKVEFSGPDVPYGFARCAVVMQAGDGLPADDRFLFSMERTDPRRVAFHGNARTELYFRNALEAATGGAYALVRETRPQEASFTVLAGTGGDESEVAEQVRRGGAAFVVLGAGDAAAGRVPLTGQRIRGTRFAARDEERFLSLGAVDETYAPLAKAALWDGVRFFQVFQAEAGGAHIHARLEDSTAVLFEQKVGEGTVIVLASALDGLANDLPLHPAFVPFVEQVAHRLSGWQEAALSVSVDAAVELGGGRSSMAIEALDPSGQRALSFEESARGRPLLVDRAGFWEVRRGAGRSQMIAANIDRRESDLEPMPRESAELWSGADAKSGGAAPWGDDKARHPLAVWVLAAALIAAAVEGFVASNHLTQEAA